jgi:protein-arginine kinase activator protein McsA
MNLVTSLLNYLKKKDTPEEQKAPEGLCPNCWGREEYGGHFYAMVKNENLDVNSKDAKVGWVQAYANKHLTDIALKKQNHTDDLVCEKCKVSYKHDDEHTHS